MSHDSEDNVLQKRLDWYEVGKHSGEGPSSSATQDAQVAPPIEDFGELAPLVQYLRYGHDSQLNTSSYPMVDPNYQNEDHPFACIDPSVQQMQPAGPSFVGPSSWSAQPYDDPRMSPQAFIGDEFGENEQFSSDYGDREPGDSEWVSQRQSGSLLNDKEVPVGDTRHRGGARILRHPLEESELEDIKLKNVQGFSSEQIFGENYPDHTADNYRNQLDSRQRRWTLEQDEELIRLHEEIGDDWAEISKKLPGVARNAAVVRKRLLRLEQRDEASGKQHKESRGRHQYRQEEDDDIRRQLAYGISYRELAEQSKYRHLRPENIKRHAKIIGADWDEDDDEKLLENVMKYEDCDMDIDWGSIGERYNPPRDAELVAAHWGQIQARYNNMKESEMAEGAGRHAQAEQSSQRQQYSGFYQQPSSQAYPGNLLQYSTAHSSSFQPVAVAQSLENVNTSSVPRYGSAHTVDLPDAPSEPANQEPGSSYANHPATATYRRQLEEHLPEIRTKLAQDWSWEQVRKTYCPGYRHATMSQFLRTRGCSLWRRRQDLHLLRLQRKGLDWAEICDQLTDPRRTEDEAQVRFAWLTKPDDDDEEE